nr:LPS export ABC transporter periplasmic protein LptC [Candidatus Calescibacterium sp.]
MSLSRNRWFIILLFCGVGFAIVALLSSFSLRSTPSGEEVRASKRATLASFPITSKGIRIRGWEKGVLRFLLEAETMELDKGGTMGKCTGGVKLWVFRDDGSVQAVLESKEAFFNLHQRNIRLLEGVTVVSSSGDRLETEELFYFNERKLIQTDSRVRAYVGGHFLESEGFRSDVDFENPEFFRVVQGTFRLESASPKR